VRVAARADYIVSARPRLGSPYADSVKIAYVFDLHRAEMTWRLNMPIFLCRWPNGDFSVVKAANKDEAIEFLDEVDNAESRPVTAIKDFMVHFALADNGEFVFENYGEMTYGHIMRVAYPVLDKAFLDAPTDKAGNLTEEGHKTIRQAVDRERERVSPRKAKEPKTLLGRRIKTMLRSPTKMIDRIVEEEAMETLKKFKGKGKPN
jgi:hypothetical protein